MNDSTQPTSSRGITAPLATLLLFALSACSPGTGGEDEAPSGNAGMEAGATSSPTQVAPDRVQAFVGATLLIGTASEPIEDGALVTQDGVITAVGSAGDVEVPEGAEVVDLEDRWLLPGLINAHGHVNGDRAAALEQLEQYAYYGVTTVVSLGGEEPGTFELRDEQSDPSLARARVFVAGPVLSPGSPDEAHEAVAELAESDPDWVKIRVDDFLGRGQAMSPDVYGAVFDAAEERDLRVAVHIVNLDDAKGVVEAGGDLIAHSVRDQPVDQELIDAMVERDICLVPTFTRELSTFTYAERPDFFNDPFFIERAAPDDLDAFLTPELQAQQRSEAAEYWREALPLAYQNMATMHEGGVRVAMGTDTGPTGRFQGYFEHLELEMMVEAGLSPTETIHSATGAAAECMGLSGVVGTLTPGAHADLLVLDSDPGQDITNTREIHGVWIAGNRVR